ncbi:hypothetical protein EJ04DRAFT_570309 [Polyplosphaeria fusca]|uniref:Uncharacterized protein n=1 Tax=Polyplosphaeria fusca TaxID=682080 RepID=A0A9P4QHQ7_9PLEO|nr:hypothetical protein EJ04DRAFT_570309 [Polyplosphaeria fusca]
MLNTLLPLFILPLAATAQWNEQVASAVSTYIASLTAAPAYSSVQSVLQTGIDQRVLSAIGEDASALFTATPTYFSLLPSGVQDFFVSVQTEEVRISESVVSSLSSESAARASATTPSKGGAGRTGGGLDGWELKLYGVVLGVGAAGLLAI